MARVNCAILSLVFAIFLRCTLAQLVIVDDTDPRLTYYSPNETWTVRTGAASNWSLYQNTDTFIGVKGATVTFANFTGSLIQYWGNQGSSHGPCNVTVDDVFAGVIDSYDVQTAAPILLFQKTDLDLRINHTIVITVVNASYPNVCEVDRFVFSPASTSISAKSSHSISNQSSLSTPLISTNQHPIQGHTHTKRASSTAIGIGIGVGVAVGVGVSCGGVLLWLYCWRKRTRSGNDSVEPEMGPPPPLSTGARIFPIPSSQSPVSPDTDPGHDHLTTHSGTRPMSWVGDLSPVTHGPSSISSYSQTSEQDDPEASRNPEPRVQSKPLPPTPHSSYRPVTGRALSHLTSLPSQYSGSTAVTGATPGMILSQLAAFDDQRDLDTSSGKYRFTATSDTPGLDSPPMQETTQPDDAIFGSTSRIARGARRPQG